LEQALNHSIVNTIIGSGNIPTSYTEWRTRALAIDAGLQRIQELKQHSSNQVQSSRTDSARTASTPSSSPHANKRGKKHQKQKNSGRMLPVMPAPQPSGSSGQQHSGSTGRTYGGQGQPMEIDRRKANSRCNICNRFGHWAKDCRVKPQQTQPVRAQAQADGQALVRYKGRQSGSSHQTQNTHNIRAFISNMNEQQRNEAIEELAKAMDA
jgi:hypothetical protein